MAAKAKQEEKEAQEGERPPLPATLAGRIAAVMGGVKRLEKQGFNSFFRYKYVTSEDVKDLIRPLLARYGIAIIPQMEEVRQESRTNEKGKTKFYTRLKMSYMVMSTDGAEMLQLSWESESQDDEDKGINKALTASMKNFLMNLFQVSTGDEVDIEDDPPTDQASGPLMDQVMALYSELHPGVKGNVLPGLFAKVCGKGAGFTQENAGRVLVALGRKQALAEAAAQEEASGEPGEASEGEAGE
jgi:hypothetical protein